MAGAAEPIVAAAVAAAMSVAIRMNIRPSLFDDVARPAGSVMVCRT